MEEREKEGARERERGSEGERERGSEGGRVRERIFLKYKLIVKRVRETERGRE